MQNGHLACSAQRRRGKRSEVGMRLGAYINLDASWQCTENVALFLVGRWQSLRPFDHEDNSSKVDYSFDQAMSGVLGLRFSDVLGLRFQW